MREEVRLGFTADGGVGLTWPEAMSGKLIQAGVSGVELAAMT